MVKPVYRKQELKDDLEDVQIIGTSELLKNRFKALSVSGKMHFLAGWLNDTVNPKLNLKIPALDEIEKPKIKRMHQIWQQMLLNFGHNTHSTSIEMFRNDLERDLLATIKHENFAKSIPLKEKLPYFKQLLALVSRGTKLLTPDTKLVSKIQTTISKLRVRLLQNFKSRFATFSISLQQKTLKLLSRQGQQPRSKLGSWVQRLRNHFSAITNEKAKEKFIDDITTMHRDKIVETLVEKQRKALYMRWTTSQPKQTSKKLISKRLFLPVDPVIDLTSDERELSLPACTR